MDEFEQIKSDMEELKKRGLMDESQIKEYQKAHYETNSLIKEADQMIWQIKALVIQVLGFIFLAILTKHYANLAHQNLIKTTNITLWTVGITLVDIFLGAVSLAVIIKGKWVLFLQKIFSLLILTMCIISNPFVFGVLGQNEDFKYILYYFEQLFTLSNWGRNRHYNK